VISEIWSAGWAFVGLVRATLLSRKGWRRHFRSRFGTVAIAEIDHEQVEASFSAEPPDHLKSPKNAAPAATQIDSVRDHLGAA
jgi:hypothetical protein